MGVKKTCLDTESLEAALFPEKLEQATDEDLKAWELIDPETGQYMPRRIRGSFRGWALG